MSKIVFLSIATVVIVVSSASAQPVVKNKAFADKWRTYAKIQIENATNEIPNVQLARTKLSEDLGKLESEFATRKAKMDPADVIKCEKQLASGKGKVTATTTAIAKASEHLSKASKHFTASTNAYTLTLWGVAGNKASEADIEGGDANRRLERAVELVEVGYEHWAVIDKTLEKYRNMMENDG